MTLILVPMVLALVAVLVVQRLKAKQADSGGSSRPRGKEAQPAVRKFVL
jgi:hypothetical protein